MTMSAFVASASVFRRRAAKEMWTVSSAPRSPGTSSGASAVKPAPLELGDSGIACTTCVIPWAVRRNEPADSTVEVTERLAGLLESRFSHAGTDKLGGERN